jgi:hypothetical protein
MADELASFDVPVNVTRSTSPRSLLFRSKSVGIFPLRFARLTQVKSRVPAHFSMRWIAEGVP